MMAAGKKRLLQLNEMEEFRNEAYENARIYKERAKKWHDKHILKREFEAGYEQAYQERLRLQQRQLIPIQDNLNDDTDSASSSQDDRNHSRIAAMHQQIIQQGKEINEIRQEQFRMQQYQLECFNTFASYFRQLQPDAQFPPSRRNDNDDDQ
ncbi:DNA-directed DNA polymerase [Melia azedarach]|uniref:DNA-directed DNA polymerase n=1 Tax=Melia azedarach TaxID=155640 RepID=A0ACC1YK40_MELAZ|nr:DNA-directed DNA polymerase [Melia azedarach]